MSGKLRRNLKWILPLVVVLFLGVGYTVLSVIKGSEPYVMAMDAVRGHEEAVQLLGEPIEDGLFPQGSIETSGPNGLAELAIPVSGSRGEGRLLLRATKELGEWNVDILILESGSQRLDLKAAAREEAEVAGGTG